MPQEENRDSSLRVQLVVGIEYIRKKGEDNDVWEARVTTAGLFIMGAIAAVILLVVILPKLLVLVGL